MKDATVNALREKYKAVPVDIESGGTDITVTARPFCGLPRAWLEALPEAQPGVGHERRRVVGVLRGRIVADSGPIAEAEPGPTATPEKRHGRHGR